MGHPSAIDEARDAMDAGENLLFVGPEGSGKRHAWRAAMVAAGLMYAAEEVEAYPTYHDARTGGGVGDLIERWETVDGGIAHHRPGPLAIAMDEGLRLLIDHAERLDADARALLREVAATRLLRIEGADASDAIPARAGFAIDAIVDVADAIDPDLAAPFARIIRTR